MQLWRIHVKIERPNRETKVEYGFYPAPTLEAAIDVAKWADSFQPPIPPFTDEVRSYTGREATAIERDSYLANIEAEGN